jgi:hypothetical protein
MKLLLGCVLLLVPSGLYAQTRPVVELFGGYSFFKANPGHGLEGADASGWNASINWNFNRWLGIKADFDGHYCCDTPSRNEHNFLFGPQISIRTDRWTLFAHAMGGGSHGHVSNFSDTVAAWALGGGIDVRPFHSERFALRLAQLDYVGTDYASEAQHNFRYSAGVVFRFGSR